jgi:hypothetical protein
LEDSSSGNLKWRAAIFYQTTSTGKLAFLINLVGIPENQAQQENAKSEVTLLDVAYWTEGKALCLFYGSTPIRKAGKIIPASPVNVVGRIISDQRRPN